MAWADAHLSYLNEQMRDLGMQPMTPLGGSIGKEGDCITVVGMQNDTLWGNRKIDEAHNVAFIISQILWSLESRLDCRWVIAVAKDYFPRDHYIFTDRLGRKGLEPYCLSDTYGSDLHWRIHEPISHLRSIAPKTVVVGFKSYHEQIHSPSAFQYTKDFLGELRDEGMHRERDVSRLVSKLMVYTGCIAATCSGSGIPAGTDMLNLNAPPDVMSLITLDDKTIPTLHDAILKSLAKNQVRRLFIVGVPFEEDVIDTAITAKLKGLATDVYIIVDATRPFKLDKTATAFQLLSRHGIKLTTYKEVVFDTPDMTVRTIPETAGGGILVGYERKSNYVEMYSPGSQMGLPTQATYNSTAAPFDATEEPQVSSTRKRSSVSFAVDTEGDRERMRAKRSQEKSGLLCMQQFIEQAADFEEFMIRNRNGEWDPCIGDNPSAGVPANLRLGTHFMKWLGRDLTRSVPCQYNKPCVALRTKFPTAVGSLNYLINPGLDKTENFAKIHGTNLFQVTVEEIINCINSNLFVSRCAIVPDFRRVMQRMVTQKNVLFFALRMHIQIKNLIDPNTDLTGAMASDAEKTYNDLRSRGVSTDEKAAALWLAERLAEQAKDWKSEVHITKSFISWVAAKRSAIRGMKDRSDLDMLLSYSLSELSTLCCTAIKGYVTSASSSSENNANQVLSNRGVPVVFVQAASPDFFSPDIRGIELGKYFEKQGVWKRNAKTSLTQRMRHLWRCVFTSFQQHKVQAISLTPLGMRPQDVQYAPETEQNELIIIMLKSLFYTLEDPWGLVQVYLQMPDYLELATEEAECGNYTFMTSLCVHNKDAKSVCSDLSNVGHTAGLLVTADACAVMLGLTGGLWELGIGSSYGFQEDIANSTTILLSHVGVRPKGLEGEQIAFHSASEPIEALLGSNERNLWSRKLIEDTEIELSPPKPKNALAMLMSKD